MYFSCLIDLHNENNGDSANILEEHTSYMIDFTCRIWNTLWSGIFVGGPRFTVSVNSYSLRMEK